MQRQLNRTTVQIDRYVTAIGESDQPVKGLVDKINALETERIALEGRLALIDAEAGGAENVVSLHPAALDRFRDRPHWRTGRREVGALPGRLPEPVRAGRGAPNRQADALRGYPVRSFKRHSRSGPVNEGENGRRNA